MNERQLITRAWQDADLEKLKQLHAEGATLLRACAAMKRPMASVKKRARELGLHFASVREVRREISAREQTQ
ncbi:hypothetical protein [Tardiphaga robiniae]|jgi:hypothetical protein|uniref:hypothetical protein n=2 Tax=Tardiphaga TaxID=1395974 RepID=UPI000B6DD356|nr:hypothetical protein [Tardiphaga robiniae]SNS23301.1 hypothetical protein SAMN05216374_0408 [Tardiphaga sp. OK246]